MKISTQTRYALRFLLELSLLPEGMRATTRSIAASQRLSEKYLETIASKLRNAGLIGSVKGAGGGYFLKADPDDITLGGVMRLMETSFFEVPCMADVPCEDCHAHDRCMLTGVFHELQDFLAATMDGRTLADMRDYYLSNSGEPMPVLEASANFT